MLESIGRHDKRALAAHWVAPYTVQVVPSTLKFRALGNALHLLETWPYLILLATTLLYLIVTPPTALYWGGESLSTAVNLVHIQ